MNASNGKWVAVKIGRSGREIHVRDCRPQEGRAGFYSRRTQCGQHSSRSIIIMHRDNVAPADLAAIVTCEKCRATLNLS
jgi:hypothetical protein